MKFRDSGGGVNHTVPVSNGLLKPPHVERIGPAFPLFLKLEDLVTCGDGTDGLVLGGKPVKDETLGKQLGLHQKTVATQRRRLEKHSYISTIRTPYGLVVRVRRSKKWAMIQAKEEMERKRSISIARGSENAPSDVRDGAKTLPEMERFSSTDGAKTLPAKKTIQRTDSQRTKEGAQAANQPSPCAFPGTHLKVSQQQDHMLGEAFPWVDRQHEYRKADSWLEANPPRRPKNSSRFLHNWFSKVPAPSSAASSPKPEYAKL